MDTALECSRVKLYLASCGVIKKKKSFRSFVPQEREKWKSHVPFFNKPNLSGEGTFRDIWYRCEALRCTLQLCSFGRLSLRRDEQKEHRTVQIGQKSKPWDVFQCYPSTLHTCKLSNSCDIILLQPIRRIIINDSQGPDALIGRVQKIFLF